MAPRTINRAAILAQCEYWADRTGKTTVAYLGRDGQVHYQALGWPIDGDQVGHAKAPGEKR